MTQISAKVPEPLVRALDRAAKRSSRTRAQMVRIALEYYLEDAEDLQRSLERLQDPGDPVLDWDKVRRDLLGQD